MSIAYTEPAPVRDEEKVVSHEHDAPVSDEASARDDRPEVTLTLKIVSVLLVSLVGFGSHWSSGVTGAMKSTLKKQLSINNAQYALLEASEDFIKTALILVAGPITDRVGGASAMLYGNALYSVGAILVAASTSVRNYHFMMGGVVVQAFGDVATQVAQYKMFSSWFAPSDGFASTLGFELGLGKIGSFVGQSTANIISKKLGDFSWVYWMAVVMNVFTNIVTVVFFFFTKWSMKRYVGVHDPATGERLTEKNKSYGIRKMLWLPWPFWCVCAFTLFQTVTATVFSSNATELAEKRFDVDAIQAGWYSAMSQYLGFFLVPVLGVVIDRYGQRLTIMCVCGAGMFAAMALAAWGETVSGTAACFGLYAVTLSLGPTTIIDSIRTSMWYQEVFGSAYAIKIAINNSMSIIIRIVSGVIQDHDNDSYDNVVVLYAILAAASLVVGVILVVLGYFFVDMSILQWSRAKRIANGKLINARKELFEHGPFVRQSQLFGRVMFTFLIALVLGAWAAYFWGVATDNNE